MHGINQCYAQYYNRTYMMRGYLFQDGFKSKILYDDRRLINVSAYINIKYIKDASDFKALSALLMKCLCDMNEKVICREMGNITQSHVARLYHRGVNLIEGRDEYKNIIKDFLEKRAS